MTMWNEKNRRRWRPAPVALVLSLLCWSLTLPSVAGQSPVVKAGYYVGGTSNLLPSSGIDVSLFTHLFYAFAQWSNISLTFTTPAANSNEMQTFSGAIKIRNPRMLTLISISTSDFFESVLLFGQQAFINASISFARNHLYDGIDLDWEYPQSQDEMEFFGVFLEAWRQAVIDEGNQTSRTPLLLTAAVYYDSSLLYVGNGSYPIQAIAKNLDFVNIMTYDYHGSWDVSQTGANTNLYDPSSTISTDHGISSWLDAGLPPDKALLGLTLYGRSWTLVDQSKEAGLGAAADAAGPAQPVSNQSGTFFYSEVVNFIKNNKATVVHNMSEVTGYCYADNVWVSYEDPFIAAHRTLYAKSRALRGYFFWQVSQDNLFQVSEAASNAWDKGEIPSGAGRASASSSVVFLAVAMAVSVSLLLRLSILDIQ